MKVYFEGAEAELIGETTQNILMDYLRAQLQASATIQAICPDGVLITPSLATAKARFKNSANQSFVLFQEDGHDQEFERIRVEEGPEESPVTRNYRGARHYWEFEIQLSARNDQAARNGPSDRVILDRKLSDLVCQIFRDGYPALLELGVTVLECKRSGKANDPNKINPHLIKAESVTKSEIAF